MFFRKKNYEAIERNYEAIERKINELVTNQQKAINNMKCPVCQGTHFTSGYKGDYGFSVTKSSLFKDKNCIFPTTFAICETCGHIEIFTMFHRIPYDDFKTQNVDGVQNIIGAITLSSEALDTIQKENISENDRRESAVVIEKSKNSMMMFLKKMQKDE